MAAEVGRFTLADGELVRLSHDELRAMYHELWALSTRQPGAVETAALVHREMRHPAAKPVELDEHKTAVFKLAQSRLAGRST